MFDSQNRVVRTDLHDFTDIVMQEIRADDERENLHRLQAGRAAYIAGIAVLTAALLWQGFIGHHVDPWIAVALGAMVFAKLLTGLYTSLYR